jgi:hypothetical protein
MTFAHGARTVAGPSRVGPRTQRVHQAAFAPQPKRVRDPVPRPSKDGPPAGPRGPFPERNGYGAGS